MNHSLVVVMVLVLSSCSYSHMQTKSNSNWTPEKIAQLENQLAESQKKIKELQTKLDALTPPASGQNVQISEIWAVPEQYRNKSITVQGYLVNTIEFGEPTTDFYIMQERSFQGAGVSCVFTTKQLDPNFRRVLATFKQSDLIQVSGLFVTDSDRLVVRSNVGNQIIVSSVALGK